MTSETCLIGRKLVVYVCGKDITATLKLWSRAIKRKHPLSEKKLFANIERYVFIKEYVYHDFRLSLLSGKGFLTLSNKFSEWRVGCRQTLRSARFFEIEFLQGYESDDSESPDTENMTNKEVEASAVPSLMPTLNARAVRQVYLLETDMMSVRWKIFHFNVSIEQNAEQEQPKCVKRFATFVLQWLHFENWTNLFWLHVVTFTWNGLHGLPWHHMISYFLLLRW